MKKQLLGMGLVSLISYCIYSLFVSKDSIHLKHDYDVVLHHVEHSWTNEYGQVQGEITSDEAKINSEKDYIFVKKPIFYALDEKNLRWEVNAKEGYGHQKEEKIVLNNDVVISHTTTPPTTMSTQSLIIFPRKNIALTDETVLIQQGNSHIEAKGMSIDFQTGRITLKHKAQGRYHDN